jgi:hypothetical protein
MNNPDLILRKSILTENDTITQHKWTSHILRNYSQFLRSELTNVSKKCKSTKRSRVTLPKNLITAPCWNVAVVVSKIPLPPSPVPAEIEGRRSAAASGQNSERVGDEVYVYSVSLATKTSPDVYRLQQTFHIPLINQTDNCPIDSSRNCHLYQAGWNYLFDCSKTVTIKQSKPKRNWHSTKIIMHL